MVCYFVRIVSFGAFMVADVIKVAGIVVAEDGWHLIKVCHDVGYVVE